jgi:hypothetical protein
MSGIVFLIEQLALGLYIIVGVFAFLALLSIRRAGREWRETHYELERELARNKQTNGWTALVLLAQMALVVLGVQQVVAPTLRSEIDTLAQVTTIVQVDGDFRSPTPAPAGVGFVPDTSGVVINENLLGEAVLATPTLTPTPVGTLLPNPPAVVGCNTPNATLQIPANGMLIFDPATVRGTAFVEDFAFYRLEIRGGALDNFAVLSQTTTPVNELGELGIFTPSVFEPGEYQFRLSVFDVTNTVMASCMVNIFVSTPPPTATPFGTLPPAGP